MNDPGAIAIDVVTAWLREDYGCEATCAGPTQAALDALVQRLTEAFGQLAPAVQRCPVAGCNRRPSHVSGFCHLHHERLTRGGAAGPAELLKGDPPVEIVEALRCAVADCGAVVERRALCAVHYRQMQRLGRPPAHMTAELPAGDPKPMLVQLKEDDVDTHRNTACAAYGKCLTWATARHWPGFSCKGCHGPEESAA